jgi:CDP-glucose 4,6-dehydratase
VVNGDNPWHGRRVLVTGHTGFKGAWLAAWLDALGARVSGFALPPATEPNLHDLLGLGARLDGAFGDVRDRAAVEAAFARARPEVVFHLAAQPLVRASYADPLGTLATNVMGTAHVLEAARGRGVAAVVVVTSDKCYAQHGAGRPFREDDPLGGHDPYSASKAAAELVAASYRDSYFANDAVVATARAGNVIGGGDWSPDRIVTDVVAAARTGQALRLRYPHATRPWQHVTDALAGYLLLGERGLAGDRGVARAWNFGPLDARSPSVAELAAALLRALGSDVPVVADGAPAPHEAATLDLDPSDAVTLLGWRPRYAAAGAIAATGAWFRGFAAGEDPRALTRAQLPLAVSA